MRHFFVEDGQVTKDRVVIVGPDVNHIRNALRMKPGERIRVSDASGHAWFCRIDALLKDQVVAAVEEEDLCGTEFAHQVVLFQGLPKSGKMEWIVQKAVELGAHSIVPVAMKNCVVKLEEKRAGSRRDRWQAIAGSAAKQSGRTVIPEVSLPVSFREAVSFASGLDAVLVAYENERGLSATRERIRSIPEKSSIGLFVGPEGGFSPEEIEECDRSGFCRISLGRRILRTETAGAAALSMLIYELDE